MLAHAISNRHLTALLAVVAVLLTVAAVFSTAPAPMVLAMGGLNAAMRRASHIQVSLTFVTGTSVRFGEGLGESIAIRANGCDWAEQTLPWLGLIGGHFLATAADLRIGSAVDWIPVAAALALFVSSLVIPAPE